MNTVFESKLRAESGLILFYDTETNGLPLYGESSEDPRQPHITQLAAELCIEATGKTLSSMNFLIQPEGWTIPDNIVAMNGITVESCTAYGIKIADAVRLFLGMWEMADLRAGHNQPFDARIIRIALMRDWIMWPQPIQSEYADRWKDAPSYCTQANSTKIVNAARPAGEKSKIANLREAYKHFTGLELIDAHNAAADVAACKAVYYGIKQYNNLEVAA